jgi:hypothetical protein
MASEKSIQGYWRVYGGTRALLSSLYLLSALIFTGLSPALWLVKPHITPKWVALSTSIVPNLLGFSIGGMAIMLSFSSGRFLDAVRQQGKPDSYFLKMMAKFYHFTLVLTCALLSSIFYQNLDFSSNKINNLEIISCIFKIGSFFGCFLFIYGIILVLSMTSSIWHTAKIFNSAIDK